MLKRSAYCSVGRELRASWRKNRRTEQVRPCMIDLNDPSAVIINHALDLTNPSKLCAATIDLVVSILASEASNLAIKVLATGGVYLVGGVAVHTLREIKTPAFLRRFKRKGRFAELMGRIPIHVIVSPAGLAGAAAFGLENSRDSDLT